MLALIWAVYAVFGLVTSAMAPLVSAITADLRISSTEMGLVLGAWPLVYVVSAPVAGVLLDKLSLRTMLGIGILTVGISATLRAMAPSLGLLFLAVALFGVGGPLISVGAPKLVALWFEGRERNMAAGVYSTASTAGSVAALSLTNSVLVPLAGGWRQAYGVLAAIAFVIVGLWWWLSREGQAGALQRKAVAAPGRRFFGIRLSPELSGILNDRTVRLILALATGMFVVGHGLQNWLPRLLQEGGLTPAEAGLWAALPNVVGIVGLLTIPRLAHRGVRARLLTGLMMVQTAGLLMLLGNGAIRLFGLVGLGLVNQSTSPVLMLLLMDAPGVGTRRMGLATGLYFSVGEIGGFLGPLLMGAMRDSTGSLSAGVLLLAVLAGLGALPALLIREPAPARSDLD